MESAPPAPDLQTLCNQAVQLHRQGLIGEAESLYLRVIEYAPDHVVCRHLLGVVRHQQGRNDEALELIAGALAAQPDYPEALVNLGTVLKMLGRLPEALAAYDKVLALRDDALAWNGRGAVLLDLNRFDEALAGFDRALALQPDLAPAMANRGRVLEYLGRFEQARASYRRALALAPGMANVYLDYADLTRIEPGDPHLAAMAALRSTVSPESDKIHLDFALAKAHADLKNHKASFEHLQRGNALKRARSSYDEAGVMAFFDRIEHVMTAPMLNEKKNLARDGDDISPRPIFILGMMRSGSTLVEQILSSHAQVHGAGELAALTMITNTVHGPDGNSMPYPEFVPGLDRQGLGDIGARYLAELRRIAPGASHVTDKMPSNFFMAGLIHLALPGARIIHTLRDPVDTCISCFSKLFTAEQPHTYELGELGRYYRRYRQLMAHWHKVLPPGRILDVHYEDVVGNLEGAAARILDHCGLPWDARCLAFHDNDRPVRTASVAQVRRKIYGEAVGRANPYEEFLGPLRAALGPELDKPI